ncbi:MAG TPA: hypothetical protein DEP45_03025 [Armatimonadetes bacterium]|nr:hypothetical protein [Armatimonadota bacterium]
MRRDATGYLIAIALLLATMALTPVMHRLRPVGPQYRLDLSVIPMQIGDLQGRVLPGDPDVQAYLEADVMRTIGYGEPPRSVNVSVIYGASWRTVHSPDQCYPSAGWQVVWERETVVPVPGDLPHDGPVQGRLMRVERDGAAQLVLFVFAHKGGSSSSYTQHALAVQMGPSGAGGLSLMASAPLVEDEETAFARLAAVTGAVYPHVISFWYPGWEPSEPQKR